MGSAGVQERRSVGLKIHNLFHYNNLPFKITGSAGAQDRRSGRAPERQTVKLSGFRPVAQSISQTLGVLSEVNYLQYNELHF